LTTFKSVLNIKVLKDKATWVLCVYCVHDTAATRGQYLA